MRVYTVGHSTRPLEAFVELLQSFGITRLADVRTVPRSRRHPHFAQEALAAALPVVEPAIEYRHFPALGGLRRPSAHSRNTAWQNASFRGYADHMASHDFKAGLEALLEWAQGGVVAVMCAEAVWWRCHRGLLSDALLAHGVEVMHITAFGKASRHRWTPFARVSEGQVSYPGLDSEMG